MNQGQHRPVSVLPYDFPERENLSEDLAGRMGLKGELPHLFWFQQGTMFWARPKALAPMLDPELDWDGYPVEGLPIEGTMLHDVERLLPFSAPHASLQYATTYVETL